MAKQKTPVSKPKVPGGGNSVPGGGKKPSLPKVIPAKKS